MNANHVGFSYFQDVQGEKGKNLRHVCDVVCNATLIGKF